MLVALGVRLRSGYRLCQQPRPRAAEDQLEIEQDQIERRHSNECQYGGKHQARGDGNTHRYQKPRLEGLFRKQGGDPEHRGRGRKQDGPKAGLACPTDSRPDPGGF